MALIPQALGLEAKDRGVSESAWIVQIAGTIIFQKKIDSWKMTIMRSVPCRLEIGDFIEQKRILSWPYP